MESVGGPASESVQVGKDLNDLLTQPGIKLAALRAQLEGLRQRQAQIVANADGLDAPGPLREQQQSLVEAMQFRVNGLTGLYAAFGDVQGTPSTAESGENLAVQAQRLIASDVVYQDLFQARSAALMHNEGVTGVPVPVSVFVTNPDFGSPTVLEADGRPPDAEPPGGRPARKRDHVCRGPAGEPAPLDERGQHGARDRQPLLPGERQELGDSQETQVVVTLTIKQDPSSGSSRRSRSSARARRRPSIFKDLPAPTFGSPVNVQVSVEPVSGETNTSNNSYEYPVIFSSDRRCPVSPPPPGSRSAPPPSRS
jgi:hypothetical protein